MALGVIKAFRVNDHNDGNGEEGKPVCVETRGWWNNTQL